MSDKLSINNEMAVFDCKDRDFYDNLTDEERKKFSTFLMIRYGSSVLGSRDLQEFYVISCNERLNKHFFALHKHPKLQWLMATTVSPGMGTQRHQWIAPKKKEAGNNKIEKFFASVYPNLKEDEIKLLAKVNDRDSIKKLAQELGYDAKQIKDIL
jgi:hypothetical protein